MENNIEQEFVSYEQAVALKELGFNEPCFGSYQLIETRDYKNGLEISHTIGLIVLNGLRNHNYKDEITNAPLKQQVFRWFREKYSLLGAVQYFTHGFFCYTINEMKDTESKLFTEYPTYEEAENACIDKLISIAKQQDK